MKPPRCRVCQFEHWLNEPHRFGPATKTATNRNSATNTRSRAATNAAQVKLAGNSTEVSDGRGSGGDGNRALASERVRGSAEAMGEVGRVVEVGVQRRVLGDVEEPGVVSAPEAGEGFKKSLEDDGVERGVGGRECGSGRTLNRRDRSDYNAYQREYMKGYRKRKAKPASGV